MNLKHVPETDSRPCLTLVLRNEHTHAHAHVLTHKHTRVYVFGGVGEKEKEEKRKKEDRRCWGEKGNWARGFTDSTGAQVGV